MRQTNTFEDNNFWLIKDTKEFMVHVNLQRTTVGCGVQTVKVEQVEVKRGCSSSSCLSEGVK